MPHLNSRTVSIRIEVRNANNNIVESAHIDSEQWIELFKYSKLKSVSRKPGYIERVKLINPNQKDNSTCEIPSIDWTAIEPLISPPPDDGKIYTAKELQDAIAPKQPEISKGGSSSEQEKNKDGKDGVEVSSPDYGYLIDEEGNKKEVPEEDLLQFLRDNNDNPNVEYLEAKYVVANNETFVVVKVKDATKPYTSIRYFSNDARKIDKIHGQFEMKDPTMSIDQWLCGGDAPFRKVKNDDDNTNMTGWLVLGALGLFALMSK